jgi:hypothetical protein
VARWDGARWRVLPPPIRGSGGLEHVVAVAPDDVWVASNGDGRGETPLVAHWDGSAWTRLRAPFGPADPLAGFTASSATDAWAVGGYRKDGRTHTLAAHWNGASWAIVPTPDRNVDSDLAAVVSVAPDDAWALGEEARSDSIASGFAEHWNGERWSIAPGRPLGLWNGTAIAASRDGAAWEVGSCYFENMLNRWDGRRFVGARHPPDRFWPADVPRRLRSAGGGCTRH